MYGTLDGTVLGFRPWTLNTENEFKTCSLAPVGLVLGSSCWAGTTLTGTAWQEDLTCAGVVTVVVATVGSSFLEQELQMAVEEAAIGESTLASVGFEQHR